MIAVVIQTENPRSRPALTFVHPSATSVGGFAPVCCRNKLFATLPKGKKGCSAARPRQQGCLLHAAIFSGVSTNSQSTKTKRSAKDILRKPNHSCLFSHQEAKLLCQEHEEDEGGLVGDRIWERICIPNPALHLGSPGLPLPPFSFCPAAHSNDLPQAGKCQCHKN